MASVAISVVLGLGGMLLQRLFQPKPKEVYGARLNDLNVPAVSPGNPVIRLWGTMRLPGQLIWATPFTETIYTTTQGGGDSGLQPSQSNGQFIYSSSVAYAICEGPIEAVNRIWADQKLIYINTAALAAEGETFDSTYYAELDRLVNEEGVTNYAAAYIAAYWFAYNNFELLPAVPVITALIATSYIWAHPAPAFPDDINGQIPSSASYPLSAQIEYLNVLETGGWNTTTTYMNILNPRYQGLAIYLGTDDQMPDPTMQAYLGAGDVPAYRNTAYVVFDTLVLTDFGNTIPTMTFEVVQNSQKIYLNQIIGDICDLSGLDPDEYDANGTLPDQLVDGYALTQNKSGREAITEMQKVFPFDAFESGWKLKFNWINQRPVGRIDRNDLGARVAGEDKLPVSDEMTKAHEFDLPKRYNLKFQERVRDFSMNHVWAVREVPNSNTVLDNEVTMALTRTEAKTWAETQLALRFQARRTYKRFLPRKYIVLEPGDAIQMPDAGEENLDPIFWRYSRLIEKQVGKNGILECTFMDHVYSEKVITAITEGGIITPTDNKIPVGAATFGFLMDCPLLLDSDPDNVGFYDVLAGTQVTWPGGALMVDLATNASISAFGETAAVPSSGTNYYALNSSSVQAGAGYATQTLMTNKHPMSWDYESQLVVMMLNRDFVLASISQQDAMYNPWNLAMVGQEIVQYCNVVNNGNGFWTINPPILRGLRGTDYAMGAYDAVNNPAGHQDGETFVQLTIGTVQRVKHDLSYLNVKETYKAVTSGTDISLAPSFTFTNTGNSLRPRAVQVLYAYKDSSHNRYLVWTPRARQNGALTDGATVVLDQPTEAYEIDVIQSGVVLKTYSFGAARNWEYTSSMQTADGVAGSSAITFNIYEIGHLIGRGFVSSATV